MSQTVYISTEQEPTVLVVGEQGPAGPAGPASSGSTYIDIQKTAGQALSGHRAVVLDTLGLALYADRTSAAHAPKVLGITTGAASLGATATIRTYGPLTEPSWSWTPGSPVFLSTSGQLTETAPTTGFLLIVGFALNATTLFIDLKPPISL